MRTIARLFAALALSAVALPVAAQVADDKFWDNRFAPPGFYNSDGRARINTLVVRTNGDLLAGGTFTIAHNIGATNLARFNGKNWLPQTAWIINGSVVSAAVRGNEIFICGDFTQVNGLAANRVARFNGSSWVTMGTGLNDSANCILAVGNDVYVAGSFTAAGGVSANHVARWNGTSWSALGSGATNGVDNNAFALAANAQGEIFCGGVFSNAGGHPASRVAKWNGTNWSAFGSGVPSGTVAALALDGNDLYIGGEFSSAGGVSAGSIARWDGSAWFAVPSGVNNGVRGTVSALLATNGVLVAAGTITALTNTSLGNASSINVVAWDGAGWSVLGDTFAGTPGGINPSISTLAFLDGALYAGGEFKTVGDAVVNNLARWNEEKWLPAGVPAQGISDGEVQSIVVAGANVYAGGTFTLVGTNRINRIARWDGSHWSPLGEGIFGSNLGLEVSAIAVSGSNVYIGGNFDMAGTNAASRVARWDGSRWWSLGSGVDGFIYSLAVADNGDLYAGGRFEFAGGAGATNIARWNGTNWFPLGRGGLFGRLGAQVNAIRVRGSQVYAAGQFDSDSVFAMTNVAVYNGLFWSSLGFSGNNGVNDVVEDLAFVGTNLYVGGRFTRAGTNNANRVACWDGSRWSALGSGMNDIVYALAGGATDLYAGGWFTTAGGSNAVRVARWNGANWSPLGSGLRGGNNSVYALGVDASSVYAGGGFILAGAKPAFQFARFGNVPPTVEFKYPTNNTFLVTPTNVTFTVGAGDSDGSVLSVDYFSGDFRMASVSNAPFSFFFNNAPPGAYNLTARATDNLGARGVSAPVNLYLALSPAAQAPMLPARQMSESSHFVNASGRLFGWGRGDSGELGNGTNLHQFLPVPASFPPGVTAWKSVAAAGGHTLAIGNDGALYGWGVNFYYESGVTNSTFPVLVPARVALPAGVSGWRAVAAGSHTSFATSDNGQIYAWGQGFWGALGLGTNQDARTPTLVPRPPGVNSWRFVSGGNLHVLAIGDNGRLYAWGNNIFGVLGDGSTTTRYSPVPVNEPSGVTAWISAQAGDGQSYALANDGRIYAWGWNGEGELGNGTTGSPRLTPGPVAFPPGVTRWVELSTGDSHGLALGNDGQLYAWGYNDAGQLGHRTNMSQALPARVPMPAGVTGWLAFAGAYRHSLALGNDCRLYTFGENLYGALGNGTNAPFTNLYCVTALGDVCGPLSTFPPQVSLDAPANGALLNLGEAALITATASDREGAIARVEFFANGTLVGMSTNSPFAVSWTPTAGSNATIIAVATDNLGANAVSAPVSVILNARPSVNLLSPASGQSFTERANVTVTCVASDADGSIALVEVFAGTDLLGRATNVLGQTFRFGWTNVPAGNYALTIRATDNHGATTVSAPANINVNARPSVRIVTPANGAVYQLGEPIPVLAEASDPDGTIARARFFGTFGAVDITNSPYGFPLTNAVAGAHLLTAQAFDNQGATMISATISFFVNRPPAVAIAVPTNGAVIQQGANVAISGSASDPDGSRLGVELYADAMPLAAFTNNGSSLAFNFTWTNPPPGAHLLRARAIDRQGGSAVSAPVAIVVNQRPSVALLSPTNGAVFEFGDTLPLLAEADDPDGTVARVDFYYATNQLRTSFLQFIGGATNRPFAFAWTNAPLVAAGFLNLVALATDNHGATATSAVTFVSVSERPLVSIVSPTNGAVFQEGGNIFVSYSVTARQGPMTNFALYGDGALLQSGPIGQPFFGWNNPPVGGRELRVAVTSAQGLSATSEVVRVRVNARPAIRLIQPTNGAVFDEGMDLAVIAEASDSDGRISLVRFFERFGDTVNDLGFASNAPYQVLWRSLPTGVHTLIALAVDNDAGAGSSTPVTIRVNARPAVRILTPTNGASVLQYAPVTLTAEVSDDGGAARVEYFDGTNKLGEASAPPFAVGWNPASPGRRSLTARVTDERGLSSTPAVAEVTVLFVNRAPSFTMGSVIGVFEDSGPLQIPGWAWNIKPGPPDEAGQSLAFLVSSEPPGFFAAPPALDDRGALTFTTAPDANGFAWVTVRLRDDGGAANGGQDTSAAQTFLVMVQAVNDPPLAGAQSVAVNEDAAAAITLAGTDVDGDALSYFVVTPPAHGALTGSGANRIYRPDASYHGPDSFTFEVNDGQVESLPATVSLTVVAVNDPPIADAGATKRQWISPNNSNAVVVLDGSRSYDAENDPLHFAWLDGAAPLAFGAVTTNTLAVGARDLTLLVDDGLAHDADTIAVEVITASESVADIIALLDGAALPKKNKRPLLATLNDAAASFDRGKFREGADKLKAFQKKTQSQISRDDPALAEALIQAAQRIINAVGAH